uniref:Uncharacterized protein n=1 Tax=Gopherus agassizii TaxID=38772 RepID=A0A452HTN6_9SAUR
MSSSAQWDSKQDRKVSPESARFGSHSGSGGSLPGAPRSSGVSRSKSCPPPFPVPLQLLKPLLEKRRRDRMNRSLERLRLLLLEATQDERLKNPKVEKAEILQKTVHFVRTQPPAEPARREDTFLQRYHSGYRECLSQATRFLHSSPGICAGKKAYLMERICHCMEKITAREPPTGSPFPNPAYGRYARDAWPSCSPPLGDPA